MRRYGVLLLVLVLAATSLLAAAAYNTATVTNAADLTVVSTSSALLRLTAGSDLDNTAWVATDGRLYIDFDKGHNGAQTGLQPGSVYYWEDLFWIRGNSNNAVDFTVELYDSAGNAIADTTQFKISIFNDRNTGNNMPGTPAGWMITYVLNNVNQGTWDTDEGHDFNKGIDVMVQIPVGATLAPHALQIVVKAHQ